MKICLQAGHKNMTTGSTGASGERDWTTTIVPMLAKKLREAKIEVYETDAFGNKDTKVTGTDWDLFLAVHYDADIYNDRGGFADYPDQSIDAVWERSKYLSDSIEKIFFEKMGIPIKNNRSNANTKFYYMWQFLSSNTPCVLIECGVGARKPEDYETLRKYELVVDTLAEAILRALGVIDPRDVKIKELEEQIIELNKEIVDLRDNRNKYRTEAEKVKKENKELIVQVEDLKFKLQDSLANADKLELIKAILFGKPKSD